MTDEKLLEHLSAGGSRQTAALQRLYQGKGREFGRFFVSRGLSRQDADDVLQETILKILQHAASFRGAGTINGWMWQIARNTLIDYQRRQASSQEHSLDDEQWERAINQESSLQVTDDPDPARLAEDCVAKGLARFAIEEPERAYAMELFVEGIDGYEIADRIGRKYGATREYLSQCRQRLAPFIEHCLPLLSN